PVTPVPLSGDNSVSPFTRTDTTSGWVYLEQTLTAPAGASYARVSHNVFGQNSTTWVDDTILRETAALPRKANYFDVGSDGNGTLYVGAKNSVPCDCDEVVDGVWKSVGLPPTWTKSQRLRYSPNVTLSRATEQNRNPMLATQSLFVGDSNVSRGTL